MWGTEGRTPRTVQHGADGAQRRAAGEPPMTAETAGGAQCEATETCTAPRERRRAARAEAGGVEAQAGAG